MAILICLILFSCFSYPSRYIQFCFIFIICLAVSARFVKGVFITVRPGNKRQIAAILPVSILCLVNCYVINYSFQINRWSRTVDLLYKNDSASPLSVYEELEPALKKNPHFLNLYAQVLTRNGDYGKAILKLEESLLYQSSCRTYLKLGDCYEQAGNFNSAVRCWETASRMIPNRFEPIYRQIKSYHENGQYDKADSLTKAILVKERKIDTPVIDLMLKDVRQWQKERDINNINIR
jgi:tetratricopeptide (TPR) repeat protein